MTKRIVLLFSLPLLALLRAASPAARQPVFIYLFSRNADHVNIELTEDRLRRAIPMLDRIRREHPQAHISATYLFSGALSQVLADRNSKNRILDLLKDAAQRNLVEVGYDGADEPTYKRRAMADLTLKTAEDRWRSRGEAAEKRLTELRDLTGLPRPGASGGLKRMQEVFGPAAYMRGVALELGGDSEVVHHIGQYNTTAIMLGMPDPDPSLGVHGFRGSTRTFGELMSPVPETSPELFWMDNVLRISETDLADVRVFSADEGVDALKTLLGKLDRSRPRIIHVEIADQRTYLQPSHARGLLYPPLRLAYDHPDQPRLPAEALRPPSEVDAAYGRQEALLQWLARDFMSVDSTSRFVSNADLRQMIGPATGFTLPMDSIATASADFLERWGSDTYPPVFAQAAGHYLSLADMFQVFSAALAELHRSGRLPESINVVKVYGPSEMDADHGPNAGSVTVASLATLCSDLDRRFHDTTAWQPAPRNMIPGFITLDGIRMNASQVLKLMAQAVADPKPERKLDVRMSYPFTVAGLFYPKNRRASDQGGTWTFKPAPLRLEGHANAP